MSLKRRWLAAAVVASMLGVGPGPVPAHAQSIQQERLSEALDRLAARLSGVLVETGPREFVAERMEASKTKVIALAELVTAAAGQGATPLAQLAGRVRQIETALARAGAPVPRLDLKLPVREHQDGLATSETIYVLAAPLEDESEVETLRAYENQQPVILDSEQPPDIPTLVLIPGESESLEPDYPLEERAEPGNEVNPRRVDDFLGIAEMLITDKNEGWSSGNPEIYAIIVRNEIASSHVNRLELRGVNNENVWYFLGDPNSSYLAYGSLTLPDTTMEIWEEDNFAHGADDFLGQVTLTGHLCRSQGTRTSGMATCEFKWIAIDVACPRSGELAAAGSCHNQQPVAIVAIGTYHFNGTLAA